MSVESTQTKKKRSIEVTNDYLEVAYHEPAWHDQGSDRSDSVPYWIRKRMVQMVRKALWNPIGYVILVKLVVSTKKGWQVVV